MPQQSTKISPQEAKSTQVSPQEAKRNASEIRKLWKLAKESGKRYPERMSEEDQRRKIETLKTAAKKKKLNLTISRFSMYRIRKVAIYNAEEIKDLGKRIRSANSRFSASHLFRIVALSEKTTRDKLESEAVSKSWTWAELDRNVRLADTRKRVPGSGRPTTVPQDSEQRLMKLAKLAT